jgi:hypothetical protein
VLTGSGVEINFFTSVLILSTAQLLLADHEGPVDYRDYLGLLAGFLSLLCSGLAVTMAIVVGLGVWLRRGWRVALLHTVPLGAAYVVWMVSAPTDKDAGANNVGSVGELLRFVVIAVQSTLDRLGQLPGLGIVTLALLACGLGLLFAEYGPAVLRGRAAIPVAMLAGSLLFLVLTGLVRAGVNHVGIKTVEGSFFASQGRYAYVVVTLLTPALALAVDTLIRRWDKLAIALAALVVVATPAYVLQYRDDARAFAQSATDKQWILTAPRFSHQGTAWSEVMCLSGGFLMEFPPAAFRRRNT